MKKNHKSLKANHLMTFLSLFCFASISGCAPVLNVYGVYFPAWIVAATIGLSSSYVLVRILAKFDRTRPIGQSGVFFVSLTVIISYLSWLVFFRMS